MTKESDYLINMMVHHYASAGGNNEASLLRYGHGNNREIVAAIKEIVMKIQRKFCDEMFDQQVRMNQNEVCILMKKIANDIEPRIKEEGLISLSAYASWMAWHEGFLKEDN